MVTKVSKTFLNVETWQYLAMKSAEPFQSLFAYNISLISSSNLGGDLYILHCIAAKRFVSRKHATTGKHLNTVLITLSQTKLFYNRPGSG